MWQKQLRVHTRRIGAAHFNSTSNVRGLSGIFIGIDTLFSCHQVTWHILKEFRKLMVSFCNITKSPSQRKKKTSFLKQLLRQCNGSYPEKNNSAFWDLCPTLNTCQAEGFNEVVITVIKHPLRLCLPVIISGLSHLQEKRSCSAKGPIKHGPALKEPCKL